MLRVGASGIIFPNTLHSFYPEGEDKLRYYSTQFDTVCIHSTFYTLLKPQIYKMWVEQITEGGNKNFKFVITAPKTLIHACDRGSTESSWSVFWSGHGKKGGCNILYENDKLGLVLLDFSATLVCNDISLKRLHYYLDIIPPGVNIGFEFKHISWWSRDSLKRVKNILSKRTGCTMVVPCLENRIINAGWAGAMFSTTFAEGCNIELVLDMLPKGFAVLRMYGSMGDNAGSYDEDDKLEHMVKIAQSINSDMYCIFGNTKTTYSRPIPPIMYGPLVVWPILRDIPYYSKEDLPSCLHDSIRLRELWSHRDAVLDPDGFVDVEFE
jgi:uncharacterized protein YecE (DUF72 family)